MNCKEFEEMINGLACDHLMLANKRVQALAHKEVCARCAGRLREERLLTEHLRLVADAEVGQTPVGVKASLMAAFAERNPMSAAPVSVPPINLPEPTNNGRWSRWAMTAAAAILILLAVVTLRLLNAQSPVNTPPNTPSPIADDKGTKDSAPQKPTPEKTGSPQNYQTAIVADNPKQEGPNKNAVQPTGVRRAAQNRQPRMVEPTTKAASQVAQNEVVTDYIPLTYLSDSTMFDSGLVVRVQVSRSTLLSMGLPMNVESSSELVKADVVVGDDGVARAIRFVHDSSPKPDGKQVK
jgi:hypothetical protein